MKLVPSNLGAEPKKLAWLGVLIAGLIGVFIYNSSSSAPAPVVAKVDATKPPVNPAPIVARPGQRPQSGGAPVPAQRTRGAKQVEDFRPSLKPKDGFDVASIDPSVRRDAILKLRNAPMEGGARSVFDFGSAPAPKVDPIKPGPIVAGRGPGPTPPPEPPKQTGPPPAPAPPPIPLKFYGYVNTSRGGSKRAFFLDGDDIFVAGENDVIRNRYKVIRIGVNSAVVEDTTDKHQQTLPLVEEVAL
jgi:hypothetical protein